MKHLAPIRKQDFFNNRKTSLLWLKVTAHGHRLT